MRVLLINSVCGIGSTGRICTELAQEFEKDGHEVKIAYGRDDNVPEQYRKYAVRIGNKIDVKFHALRTRILDEHGFGSKHATKKFLEWAEAYKPDLLWLHNIHGYYINIEMLFSWIKKHPEMGVKWTLHDCWAFTGHCSHFTAVGCDKWKNYCKDCPQKDRYPSSKIVDNSNNNFNRKKKAFTGVKNMTLITPSKWLAGLVKQSYLGKYPIAVCYNKIDTTIFKPTPSDFREKYGLVDKKIILGVASDWNENKGINDFIILAHMLDESYKIVLVGMSKKQIKRMPDRIKNALKVNYLQKKDNFKIRNYKVIKKERGVVVAPSVENLYLVITGKEFDDSEKNRTGTAEIKYIPKSHNAVELAQMYTVADYFVNPTHEDNYPTVNLEAQACGTFVITYDTGGCRETLDNV